MKEINSYIIKIERLKLLIKKLKSWDIGYSELFDIKTLLIELNGFTEEEFDELLKKYEFNTLSKLFDYIYDQDSNKIRTSELFATLAGKIAKINHKFTINNI